MNELAFIPISRAATIKPRVGGRGSAFLRNLLAQTAQLPRLYWPCPSTTHEQPGGDETGIKHSYGTETHLQKPEHSWTAMETTSGVEGDQASTSLLSFASPVRAPGPKQAIQSRTDHSAVLRIHVKHCTQTAQNYLTSRVEAAGNLGHRKLNGIGQCCSHAWHLPRLPWLA